MLLTNTTARNSNSQSKASLLDEPLAHADQGGGENTSSPESITDSLCQDDLIVLSAKTRHAQ